MDLIIIAMGILGGIFCIGLGVLVVISAIREVKENGLFGLSKAEFAAKYGR